MAQTVSVIVPVYNCKGYLEKCIESILAQTYPDLQVILVDDGSTDGSGEICDFYAEKDSRIHVIHQKNQGVSAARNAGLDAVTGEYLLFMDGDDGLDPNTIACALKGFETDEIDVSVFGVTKISVRDGSRQDLPMETGIFSAEQMLYGILKDYAGYGAGYPVNKIWRVKAFGSTQQLPRFNQSLYFFEDLEWVIRMMLHINKANLLPAHYYQYHIHSSSVTNKPGDQERREIGYHCSVWEIINALDERPVIREWFQCRYYPEIVNGVIHALQHGYRTLQKTLLRKMMQIKGDILCSASVSSKIKLRCRLLSLLTQLHIL